MFGAISPIEKSNTPNSLIASMNGTELYRRVVSTVQEMHLKIGDSHGSVSLYYPFQGDFPTLQEEFRECSKEVPSSLILERLPERVRVIVPEEDCAFFMSKDISGVLRDVVSLVNQRLSLDCFIKEMSTRYPEMSCSKVDCLEFDAVMSFPDGSDPDIYCLAEEMGQVTYHRFSEEDYLAMGFQLP